MKSQIAQFSTWYTPFKQADVYHVLSDGIVYSPENSNYIKIVHTNQHNKPVKGVWNGIF